MGKFNDVIQLFESKGFESYDKGDSLLSRIWKELKLERWQNGEPFRYHFINPKQDNITFSVIRGPNTYTTSDVIDFEVAVMLTGTRGMLILPHVEYEELEGIIKKYEKIERNDFVEDKNYQ